MYFPVFDELCKQQINDTESEINFTHKQVVSYQECCSFPLSSFHSFIQSCREVSSNETHKNIQKYSCCHQGPT